LTPWCADLFADRDLRARCQAMRLPGRYPHAFRNVNQSEVAGPWMYTGGLENWPWLVMHMAAERPLWGNGYTSLGLSRSPGFVARSLSVAGLPVPALGFPALPAHLLHELTNAGLPRWQKRLPSVDTRWLVKPLAGAGGSGIRWYQGTDDPANESPHVYLQEYIEGEPVAVIYVADGCSAQVLGVTKQLVGADWLHAAPFHYCGSIGPLALEPALRTALEQLGRVLVENCALRGLFGVDGILHQDSVWPVEINPRYTASVEVLEYALGIPALAVHQRAFDSAAPAPTRIDRPPPGSIIGKAILFAREELTFPREGPWMATLDRPAPVWDMPAFADIPAAGQRIEGGRPILTLFASGATIADCEERLRHIAGDLDHWLWKK
jgi:predicted ATP-grasp superfamily ATP-dependent carboligase